MTPGTQLGSYEILSPLGKGGMGEVWRARDSKLGREVAIKTLPEEFAKNGERLARFEREAKLLASLNHPNIAAIYGLEEDNGTRFLVLELVEGDTLADRLKRGAIPVEESLKLALQIAEGLEAAHEKGVIHRDLKPANIKVTPDGNVKVLDFGLAKALAGDGADVNLSQSPTLSLAATQQGVILGTAAYMSPEQARGHEVDKRADIWAFGCVLYEMLAGRPVFQAPTVSDTLAFVLTRDVDWTALPGTTPFGVERLLQRCFERDPKRRLRDVGDARLEIHEVLQDPNSQGSSKSGARVGSLQLLMGAAVVIPMCVLLGFLIGRGQSTQNPSSGELTPPSTRTTIELPSAASLAVGTRLPLIGFESPAVAVSPDGTQLVYVGESGTDTVLYYRPLDEFANPRPLPETEGAIHAFFSPDGSEIGFLTSDRLKTSIDGSPTTISRARTPIQAFWVANDVIYILEDEGYRLSRISSTAAGGERDEVIRLGLSTVDQVLPDGQAALLSTPSLPSSSRDHGAIEVLRLDTRQRETLLPSAYSARYLASGHLEFARAGALWVVGFDADRLEVIGEAVSVERNVAMQSVFGTVHAAASDNGTLVYVPGGDLALGKLAWVDRQGNSAFLDVPERVYGILDVNPDDQRIAIEVADVNDYIWLWDGQTGLDFRIGARQPRWDFTGERLAFLDGSPFDPLSPLFIHEIQGPEFEHSLRGAVPSGWAENELISFDIWGSEVGVISTEPGSEPTSIQSSSWGSSLSPDGSHVSFNTDETGRNEVWVVEIGGTFREQVSDLGGVETVWCAECDELFYRNGSQIYASRVTRQPSLEFGSPRVVFEAVDFIDTGGKSFDVSSDGQRLYYIRRTIPNQRNTINVVVNWFEELKERVPVP